LSVKVRIRREWTPRVGEAAVEKLIRSVHERIIQLWSVGFLFVWSVIPLIVTTQIWTTLPFLFRAFFTIVGITVILFGMALPGRRRAKKIREAAVCALNYLRATNYPTLTRLPYIVMRSPQAFDRYIVSVPATHNDN